MKIAYVMSAEKGDMDRLLHDVGLALLARGTNVCGVVQINSERPCEGLCDMDVQVLPDGPVLRISQDLGSQSKGCRLDPEVLEQAVGLVEARLEAGAECLLINKFGKHEASGRGFRNTIGQALAADVPVVVGLNAMNEEAFNSFTDGLAERLSADKDAILAWLGLKSGQDAA